MAACSGKGVVYRTDAERPAAATACGGTEPAVAACSSRSAPRPGSSGDGPSGSIDRLSGLLDSLIFFFYLIKRGGQQ